MHNPTVYCEAMLANVPIKHREVGDCQTLIWLACMIGRILVAPVDCNRYMLEATSHLEKLGMITAVPGNPKTGGGGLIVEATKSGRRNFAETLVEKDPDGRYSVTLDIPEPDTKTRWFNFESAIDHAVECFEDADWHTERRAAA